METRHERSDLRAGVLTTAVIAGLAAGVMILPSFIDPPMTRYQFIVRDGEDLSGIERGTRVLVAGLERGRVLDIVDEPRSDGRVAFIVHFELLPDPPIFQGATARIARDAISNQALVDFFDTGQPALNRVPLAADSVIRIGENEKDADRFLPSSTRNAIGEVFERTSAASESWPPMFQSLGDRGSRIKTEALELRDAISATFPPLRDRATELADRFGAIRSRLEELVEEFKSVRAEYDLTTAAFNEGGSWPRIRATFVSIGEEWSKMSETAAALQDRFAAVKARAIAVQDALGRLRAHGNELINGMGFGDVSADLVIAAEEYARLFAEGSAAPWTVLIPGGTARDSQRDALDDVSRMLLRGVQESRAAELSLRRMVESDALGRMEQGRSIGDLDRITEALERLSTIEQALWQLRIEGDVAPRGAPAKLLGPAKLPGS